MNRFPYLARRLFNQPVALSAEALRLLSAEATGRPGPSAFFDDDEGEISGPRVAFLSGIAVIPVRGILVKDDPAWHGITGYDLIRECLCVALDDPEVRAIVLDVSSPGGEVSGCFDLVDAIYQARDVKPIWAILSENAYSAAYAIASAAARIVVPRTGGTGSVGVIAAHVDLSKALETMGIAVTLITYGDRKADGNEFSPLSAEALARFQADIDAMGDLFVKTVARNRGLGANVVRGTQATTFLGAAGVEIGFADAVMAPDAAFRALLAELG